MPRIELHVSPVTASAPVRQKKADAPLMDGTAWVGDKGLTATRQDVLDRLRRKELSISTAQGLTLDSCAVAMVASRLLPRDDDAFEANQLGTAAHGALEIMFGHPGAERTQELALAIIRRLASERDFALSVLDEDLVDRIHALNEDDLKSWFEEVDRRVLGLWKIEDPTQVEVHATEMSFGGKDGTKVMVGRVPFIGFIDRVDVRRDESGEIVAFAVNDYKAGKVKKPDRYGDDYGDQIKVYSRVVESATGMPAIDGGLLFITYGVGRRVDCSREAVDAAVAKLERAWDRMHALADANLYPFVDGALCGWCELVNICPSAKANGRTDLSDTEKVDGKRVKVEGKKSTAIPADKISIPTVAAPVQLGADAAHRDVNEELGELMTAATTALIKEGNSPREDTADDAMNGGSFAATAVFGVVSLAVETLAAAGQPVNKANVTALAQTFAHIVQSTQFTLSGTARYGEGLNARLRGALRTAVETIPAPFGSDRPAWDQWVTSVTNRTKAIAIVALDLFNTGTDIPDSPWAVLATESAN